MWQPAQSRNLLIVNDIDGKVLEKSDNLFNFDLRTPITSIYKSTRCHISYFIFHWTKVCLVTIDW